MLERVMSKKKSKERTLIKNSLVIKGNAVSNTATLVFLCINARSQWLFLPRRHGEHRATQRSIHPLSQFLATRKVAILKRN